MVQKKDEADLQRAKSSDPANRRSSVFYHSDFTEPFVAIEAALTAWGSACKSGGVAAGVAMAWKFVPMVDGSPDLSTSNSGCVDGIAVLICIRVRLSAGIALFDAFGFNCPLSLIKAECDSGPFHFVISSIVCGFICLIPHVSHYFNYPICFSHS